MISEGQTEVMEVFLVNRGSSASQTVFSCDFEQTTSVFEAISSLGVSATAGKL